MDFKTATDRLTDAISHADIAKAAHVSVQSIRQARLAPNNPSHRSPPEGWRKVLASLARERSLALKALADELD
jgi:hypothetical protein